MSYLELPKVSVLMPVYNAERYLATAVQSILDQSFADVELILIDDGSSDNSLAILRGFERHDPRVRLISRPNTGYVIALNEMIELATGQYLARMDSDDIALPDRLEKQVRFLDANSECVAVGSDVLLIDEDGDTLTTWEFERTSDEIDKLHMQGHGPRLVHPAAMIRAAAMRTVGGYRVDMETAEDMDLWLRLAEVGELANLDEVLLHYRVHSMSVSHQNRAKQAELRARIHADACRRRGGAVTEIDFQARLADNDDLSSQYTKWCWWALRSGERSSARKYALRAFRAAPTRLVSWKLVYNALFGRGRE